MLLRCAPSSCVSNIRQSICRVLLSATILGAGGCGGEYPARTLGPESGDAAPAADYAASPGFGGTLGRAAPVVASEAAQASAKHMIADADAKAPEEPARPARKIIYNAQVTLVVESVGEFGKRLGDLVKQAGGYISRTDQTSENRERRSASWTVRVPVDRFDELFSTVGRMGEMQQSHLDTQDVSMEYYDIEARIANKQQEEKRLQKHLSDSTGKLEDILAVERELTRVRGEIEQMQGRIRYLANVTAYSTVTINATELIDFTPPVRPTFGTQIGRTFRDSLGNLGEFVKGVVLVAVAAAPWLPLLCVIAVPLAWAIRRRRARRSPKA